MKKKAKKKKATIGECKLTGEVAPYVKAHIIPEALTKRDGSQEPFIEAGIKPGVMKRFTSWYDYKLVTLKGEAFFKEIDNKAISLLRRYKLVWSGWGNKNKLEENDILWANAEKTGGFRELPNFESDMFRLFIISVLWRTISSSRYEFNHLDDLDVDVEFLKNCILKKSSGDYRKFPMIVHQIVTRGPVHNQTPITEKMNFPKTDSSPAFSIDTYRIYMQGLIVHVLIGAEDWQVERLGGIVVGAKNNLFIGVNPFEASRQRDDMISVARYHRTS